MKTTLDLVTDDIKGYKTFSDVIDIGFVVALLKHYKDQERLLIIDAFREGQNNSIPEEISCDNYFDGDDYYKKTYTT